MENKMDPVVRTVLFGDEAPAGDKIGGTGTDGTPHPVEVLFHTAEFGIAPPNATPVKKLLTVQQIEDALAARRQERRKALIAQHPAFFTEARARINAALLKDRDAVVASAGDLTKLFGM
jgi:hypothetical protein